MENRKDKISLITAMTIYGTIGLFVRALSMPSAVVAFFRGLIGSVFLCAVIILRKKGVSSENLRKNLVMLIISGAAIGINWILLFEAYRYTSVSIATLCYYLAPAFVTILSPLILKERLTPLKMLFVALSLFGMYLISGIGSGDGGSFAGILFGIGAAVLYASVILMNKFIRDMDAYEKTATQLISATAVILPYILITGGLGNSVFDARAVIVLLIIGVIHTGVAYWLYFGCMDGLKAQTIAIYSYVDPVVAIILSALILREHMGIKEIIGAVLILGSTLLSDIVPVKDNKNV
ncbi:MAG: EamA family transporter [Oscillospiraceae bacterium]|nr:EamA family transporter [Oscillospiraceae bacterium]